MPSTAPKYAVIYYSRSGYSDRLAMAIADNLSAEAFPLRINRYSMRRLGYMRAGYDSLRGNLPAFQCDALDLSDYDAVVICGPVWTSFPATPIRSFLTRTDDLPANVGLALTCGEASPPQKAFDMAEQLLGRKFVAKAHVPNQQDGTPEMKRTVRDFCAVLHREALSDHMPDPMNLRIVD